MRNTMIGTTASFAIVCAASLGQCVTTDHEEVYFGATISWHFEFPCGGSSNLVKFRGTWDSTFGGGATPGNCTSGDGIHLANFRTALAVDNPAGAIFFANGRAIWNDDNGTISMEGGGVQLRKIRLRDLNTNDIIDALDQAWGDCIIQSVEFDMTYPSDAPCSVVLVTEYSFTVSCWQTLLNDCGGPSVGSNNNGAYNYVGTFLADHTGVFSTSNDLGTVDIFDGQPYVGGVALAAYNFSPIYQYVPADCVSTFENATSGLLGAGTVTTTRPLYPNVPTVRLLHRSGLRAYMDPVFIGGCPGETCTKPCPADLSGDCAITVDDLTTFLLLYEQGNIDLDGDNATTIDDLLYFMRAFEVGACYA